MRLTGMRSQGSRTPFVVVLAILLAAGGCESGPMAPDSGAHDGLAPQFAKGGRKTKDEPTAPEPTPGYVWYSKVASYDYDPLSRYGQDGDQVLLQTDPTVTSWGTDYWGYWSDPYTMVGNTVQYTIGLTHTTYTFSVLADGRIDVSRTLVTQPYPSGDPVTTETHVGIFERE